ncbi:Small integral membrane protein 12 [Frankliniella fusca]|uniref:Small integral membrane protein 12 n=1 Tax=Frankliniella fusca TaxID=407009 RepID=A0AAE1LSJ5_9NEOP|nr:Small integral membrane protein 12 [Frankliniella fusca]
MALPQILMLAGRRYIMMPIAIVGGTIGYLIESYISDKKTPGLDKSIDDIRVGRLVESELSSDPTNVESLKEKKFVPKTIFEKNVSPSLQTSS